MGYKCVGKNTEANMPKLTLKDRSACWEYVLSPLSLLPPSLPSPLRIAIIVPEGKQV